MPTLHPHLMFEGQAEEALTFYVALFADGEVVSIQRYGAEGPGKEGSVIHATFRIAGQTVTAIDSYVSHGFTFTPSMSLFITCDDEAQLKTLYERLSEGGKALMPLADYGFSRQFGWVADRFGVSWQLNLP